MFSSKMWFGAALTTFEASDYLRVHRGRAVQAMHILILASHRKYSSDGDSR